MLSDVAGAAAPDQEHQQQQQDSEKRAPRTPPQPRRPSSSHDRARTPPQESRHPTNSHSHPRRTGGGQVPSRNQAGNNECQFFFEDEVFRIDRRGRVHFGVVTETSESYSSDEDEEIDEVLSKGEVRVAFYPDGKEMVHTERSVSKLH